MRAITELARGITQTLGIVGGFAAAGLWLGVALSEGSPYPVPMAAPMTDASDDALWLVDGFNVLHAGVLKGRDPEGWWKAPWRAELMTLATAFDEPAERVWVVFDGSEEPEDELPDGAPQRVFAPSADHWILDRLRADDHPQRIRVVTADRKLAARARDRGARVVSPWDFLERCRAEGGRSA